MIIKAYHKAFLPSLCLLLQTETRVTLLCICKNNGLHFRYDKMYPLSAKTDLEFDSLSRHTVFKEIYSYC